MTKPVFLCGKMTAGKSTLAKDLAKRENARGLPPGTSWTTDAEFEAITVYFQPPSEDERFNVVRHERTFDAVGVRRT